MSADSLIVLADTIRKTTASQYLLFANFKQKSSFFLPFFSKQGVAVRSGFSFFAIFCLFSFTSCKVSF